MTISGRHFGDDAHAFVDGRRVAATVSRKEGESVVIELETLPSVGLHLLQVQVPDGMFSNDFLFHVAKSAEAATALKRELDSAHLPPRDTLAVAIAKGDLAAVRKLLPDKAAVNKRRSDGSTPLSTAALHGQREIARHLIDTGADAAGANSDGNTPLHVAAFLCRTEVVKLLLEKGASVSTKNGRRETPIDVVSGPWSRELADW
jgi:ankyrin repeat protein